MSLVELARELNFAPRKTASTNGGEYHSACPNCGGKDRFIIWEQKGRYFCRQCQKTGDAIQFCRDFMGMDFHSACAKLNIQSKKCSNSKFYNKSKFVPSLTEMPPLLWRKNADQFVKISAKNLEKKLPILQRIIVERNLTLESIQQFCIGWNPINQFLSLSEWGIPDSFSEQGKEKKLWLPRGIVIPTLSFNEVIKLKIRRSDWHESDKFPKYVEISGSMKGPSIYGNINAKLIIILEAQLDAILVQQFASDLCCCMAIGGAGKKPDSYSDQILRNSSLVLFALDFDEAGKQAYQFWRSNYSNLRAWPTPRGKSPGDTIKMGTDIREWILSGISQFNKEF